MTDIEQNHSTGNDSAGIPDPIGVVDVLTLEEAAEFLKVPTVTLVEMVKAGRLPGARFGRHYRFLRSELIGFLQNSNPGPYQRRTPG